MSGDELKAKGSVIAHYRARLNELSLGAIKIWLQTTFNSKKLNDNAPSDNNVGAASDKKKTLLAPLIFKNKLSIIVIFTLLLVALLFVFFYLPQQQALGDQEEKVSEINSLQLELEQLTARLAIEKQALLDDQRQHELLLTLSYSQAELDRLFGSISYWGSEYLLLIEKIEQQSQAHKSTLLGAGESLKAVHINISLSGKYRDYLQLREQLLNAEKAVAMIDEEITVASGSSNVLVNCVVKVYLQAEDV